LKKHFYTLHLISDGRSNPIKLTFNITFARILLGLLVAIIIIIIIGTVVLLPKALKYNDLLAENNQLIQDRLTVMQILSDYNKIRQMDQYIRSVLGADLNLPSLDSINVDSLSIPPVLNNRSPEKSFQISYLDNVPIYPPVAGYITQGFVDDHTLSQDNHYGVDIASPEGAPVCASASGVVVFSNWTYDLGYMVILYHSNGYFTIYGHNQRNAVNEHQYVNRGDIIGYLGNTGISQGPHLHFEIWREGKPIDPQSMIYSYRRADISVKNYGRQ
jgi:murein DD-endopeptidase MepM/ murein hydrolase activator NlpD